MIAVNIVGVGHWGPNLVRAFATHPRARVRTVCDLSEERLSLVRGNIPMVQNFTSDSLGTVTDPGADAVIIATPVSTHHELSKAALEAGKHVLVEKPLCHSATSGEELVELARRQGKHLCVGHVFLFNNGVRGMRDLIRAGDLGSLRYFYSTRTNLGPFRHDVNALWDLAAHDLSIFNYWLDSIPLSVTARGQCYLNPEVEDLVTATFTYPNRLMASVHVSWLNPRKVREITVVGSNKMAVWDDMNVNEPLRIYHKSVTVERKPVYSDSFGSFRMLVQHGDVLIPHVTGPEPLAAECNHFIDCIEGRAEPINTGAGGVAVLRALEAADQSMREESRQVALKAPCTLDASADIGAEELRPVSISRAKIGNGHVHRPVEQAVT
jgi:predicted dehydrogenase